MLGRKIHGILLAGAFLAGCSQQMGQQTTAQQVGGMAAARMAPKGAQVVLHDLVLHPGMQVQSVSSANAQKIAQDFNLDVKNYGVSGGQRVQDVGENRDPGRLTTIGALKAKGMFLGSVYANSTQVVLKSAGGRFQDVYDTNPGQHPTYRRLVAIYDPQTGDPLGVGLQRK